MVARILSIAGSDSGGGAGIQADLKTIQYFNGFGMTALTAITAQNTLGVQGIHAMPASFVHQQIKSVLDDIGVDAIKTGMLCNQSIIEVVANCLANLNVYKIIDPVMVATSGDVLLDDQAIDSLSKLIIPQADLLTPNIKEAEVLTGTKIGNLDAMHQAADKLLKMGAKAVLVKGGHMQGLQLTDLLKTTKESFVYTAEKQNTRHTHGTGCTYAAAIATLLGQGKDLPSAVESAHSFIQNAIKNAPGLGKGNGPLCFRINP